MTLDKSVNRLSWQFSRGVSFKPTQTDVDALNTIFEWISSQKNISLLNQGLFAKLYILKLNETLLKYDSTIFEPLVQKEVSRILALPIETFYQSFHTSLHHNQLKKLNLKDGFTVEDIKEKYTLEVVTDQLQGMITEAINKFL